MFESQIIDQDHDDKEKKEKPPMILCMNYTESKYYIYSENGKLTKRVNYKKRVDKLGNIIATSANGHNFIFWKKNTLMFTIMCIMKQDSKKCQTKAFELKDYKTVDIKNFIKNFAQNNQNQMRENGIDASHLDNLKGNEKGVSI